MKLFKKVMAVALSAAMVLAMSVVGVSADTTSTITGPSDGHTYKVWQIFTGDLNGSTLSNVKWGANGTGTVGAAVDEATLTQIQALASNSQATANAVGAYVDRGNEAKATLTDANPTAIVENGYYLIEDMGATEGTTEAYSTYVVAVVKDVTVSPKRNVPSFEKKVQDINDSTETAVGQLQDSADYDIGDDVPFTLTATVAENYADYTHYYFEFSDQMEPSLTFDSGSVKVTLDGTELTSDQYQLTTGKVVSGDSYNGGDKFSVVFTDLKTIGAAHAGSKIVVTYTAKLNNNAVLGSTGNVNEAKLIYSNNPNDTQEGKPETPGETPWDNVIVFTYKVIVNKVDSEKQPLKGAAFELQKYDKATESYVTVKSLEAGEATSFTFSGLDDGKYKLKETTTPAGYNTIEDIEFTVDATHTIIWENESRDTILTDLNGNRVSGEISFTKNVSEGSLSSDIVNKKGAELPSTGGIGTTIFYVVGTVLVLGAAVVMITRKRMSSEK